MTKTEFLEALRRALNGNMAAASVEDNLKFYENYFYSEEAKGRSEAAVLSELGDPRILARTLIDAAERAGDAYAREANETQFRAASGAQNRDEYREEAYSQGNGRTVKRVHMPGWLIAILVIMLFVVVYPALSDSRSACSIYYQAVSKKIKNVCIKKLFFQILLL